MSVAPRKGPSTVFVPEELPKEISSQRENIPWELVFPSKVQSQNRGTIPGEKKSRRSRTLREGRCRVTNSQEDWSCFFFKPCGGILLIQI